MFNLPVCFDKSLTCSSNIDLAVSVRNFSLALAKSVSLYQWHKQRKLALVDSSGLNMEHLLRVIDQLTLTLSVCYTLAHHASARNQSNVSSRSKLKSTCVEKFQSMFAPAP